MYVLCMFLRGRTFHFSHFITLMVFGAFLSISATEALYKNLHSQYKTFCSALLAMEKQHATVTLSELQIKKLMRQMKYMAFAKQN